MSEFVLDAYIREKLFYIGKTVTKKTSIVSEQKGPIIKVIPQHLKDMEQFPEQVMEWYTLFKNYCMTRVVAMPHITGKTVADLLTLHVRKNAAKKALSPEQFERMFVLKCGETNPETISNGIDALADQVTTLPEDIRKRLLSVKDIEFKSITADMINIMESHKSSVHHIVAYSDRINALDDEFLTSNIRPSHEEFDTLKLIDNTENEIEQKFVHIARTQKCESLYTGLNKIMDSVVASNTTPIDRKDTETKPAYPEQIEFKRITAPGVCIQPLNIK